MPRITHFAQASAIALAAALAAPALAAHSGAQPPLELTPPPQAAQYDFLIGEWTLTATPKVSAVGAMLHGAPKLVGTLKARKAFDGWGVQDELRLTDGSGNPRAYTASTRYYDLGQRRWSQATLDVYRNRFAQSTASWDGSAMTVVSTGVDAQGTSYAVRSTFSDIRKDGFRIVQDRSYDGGKTWDEAVLTIEATRAPSPARN